MAAVRSVLIVGGSGFVGTQLALQLRESFKVFATHYRNPIKIRGVTSLPLNVDNRNWIKTMINRVQPDVIIYAITSGANADGAKTHITGVANVMSISDILQPLTIYLSNAYVFDGKKGNYKEPDLLLPQNLVGKTKYESENLVRAKSINSVILRSSPLLGRGNGYHFSLLDYLRVSLDRGRPVTLPDLEAHSFVSSEQFTDLVEKIIRSGMKNKTVHLGGRTKLTPFQLGKLFARHMHYDENLIMPAVIAGNAPPKKGAHLDYSLNSGWAIENLKIQPLLLEQSFDLVQKKLIA
jgi:dTDP-4-dehydrorhamnose reductase